MTSTARAAIAIASTGVAEGGEAHFTDGGPLAQFAGLLLVLPFVAFLFIIFFGKRMKYLGAEFAIGAMAINFLYAVSLFVVNITSGVARDVQFEIGRIGVIGDHPLVFEL
ncbi:MAG: hypothetical protein ACT4OP_03155, partial [Actinomycetota bacterium]